MFYHKKQTFIGKEFNGYSQKVTICLHNGLMKPNKNYDITITIEEHITRFSSGTTTAMAIDELINHIKEKRYRFDLKAIDKYFVEVYSERIENVYKK